MSYLSTTTVASAAVTSVAASATVVDLLAANPNAHCRSVYNDSTATLYLKHGSAASTTSHTVQVQGGDLYEFPTSPLYAGLVTGVWSTATGSARVTEG